MKTHDNQKPFQCTICNRGYNTAAALTSHMQNHKKQQAALLGAAAAAAAAGSNYRCVMGGACNLFCQIYNFTILANSPRSTGSTGSSNGSCLQPTTRQLNNKRKYSPTLLSQQPNRLESRVPSDRSPSAAKRSNNSPGLYCIYCTKSDFLSMEQLHSHIQTKHSQVVPAVSEISISLIQLFTNYYLFDLADLTAITASTTSGL